MSSATPDVILTTDRERVRLLTFNRPDRANAFNEMLYHAAADALHAAEADDDVAVVVLTGGGKAFCAGTDLLEMAETVDGTATTRTGFPAFVDALQQFPKPLVAAVNGAAVGLGLTMLAHCDLVFVSDDARLLAPFTNMGVAPEAASSYLLPRRMGRQRASLSLFTSNWISAEDAVATGLAVQQCRPDALLDDTMAVIAYLRSLAAAGAPTPGPLDRFNLLGITMLGAGLLPDAKPVTAARIAAPPRGPTAQYGEYLLSYQDCRECHGRNLSGGVPGQLPPLGPGLGIINEWTLAQFIATMRTGIDPNGHQIGEQMPWRPIGRMDDDELAAMYQYLTRLSPS